MYCSVINAAVLYEKHRERVTQIWTSPSEEEEEEEEDFGRLVTFWFGTFAPLGMLFVMKTLEDEQ